MLPNITIKKSAERDLPKAEKTEDTFFKFLRSVSQSFLISHIATV